MALSRWITGLKGLEIVDGLDGLGGPRGGGEDHLGIGLKQLQPVAKVVRMIGAYVLADAKLGAEKRGADLRDEFFGDIGGIAKALA
jgi:hypothetical protein